TFGKKSSSSQGKIKAFLKIAGSQARTVRSAMVTSVAIPRRISRRKVFMIALSADGVPIAYSVHGAGAPLILLHGFTETSASWEEIGYIEPFLRAGRQVVLIDARGHGASGKPHEPGAYTGKNHASD